MTTRLQYFARCYFHPDYDLEAGTETDAIRLFKAREKPAAVAELVTEIQHLLASSSEADMKREWVDSGDAYFEPELDGMTYREWFEKVLDVLREPQS